MTTDRLPSNIGQRPREAYTVSALKQAEAAQEVIEAEQEANPGSLVLTQAAPPRPAFALAPRSIAELDTISGLFAQSGMFSDVKSAAQCAVKVLAGAEVGLTPFAAMTGVYIVQGKPSYSANVIAAAIKSSGRYDYRILERTDTACEIVFYERRQEVGRERFTIEDATRALLTKNPTWQHYPKSMLFARALTSGARTYCPDVLSGQNIYTPEELEPDMLAAEDGTPVALAPAPAPEPAPATTAYRDHATSQLSTNPRPSGNGARASQSAPPQAPEDMDRYANVIEWLRHELENRGIRVTFPEAEHLAFKVAKAQLAGLPLEKVTASARTASRAAEAAVLKQLKEFREANPVEDADAADVFAEIPEAE